MEWKIGLILLPLLLLVGCGMEHYSSEHILNCKEGKYREAIDADMTGMEDAGMELDYIRIVQDGDMCIGRAVLKEPVVVMGSEVKSLDSVKCYIPCIDVIRNSDASEGNKTNEVLLGLCCEIN